MNRKKRWEIYFQQHKCPCFITDLKSKQIVYHNEEFSRLFDVVDQAIGKKIYDIILIEDMHLEKDFPNWQEQTCFESNAYNKKLNMQMLVRATVMKSDDAVFCEIIPIENDEKSNGKFEEAMVKCMEIYGQSTDMILPSLMELLSNFYNCERAYIYKMDFIDEKINCIAQWCENPKNRATEEIGTKIDVQIAIKWIKEKQKGSILTINEADYEKNSMQNQILNKFSLENITINTIEDVNHEIVGMIGLSNRKNTNSYLDTRLINTIARLVAQEVTRENNDKNSLQLQHSDVLTGLYNRVGYSKRIEQILEKNPKSMGVISVNINGLRYINEQAGISRGDLHIKKSAKLLQDHFGFEFFRMSGDEFLGIAPDVCEEEFEDQAMSLYMLMREKENYDFSLGHTWGSGKIDMIKLIQEADMLMYINKQQYYSVSSKKEFETVSDTTLSDLLSYIENDEFMVYLQPQVRLKDGSHYGAEALIRRFDKTENKMVFPDQFIPFYEQKSVIRHVDMFVLETVCKLQSEWIKQGKLIPISVNFSRVTLQEYGIVESITEICDKHKVPHNLVVIEVTERVGLIENNVASELIRKFKEKDFHISLDDFGCAYSNIVTLAQIEVDEVKIDKSLVDYIISNKKNHVLVKNILSMCNELEGISTLAEGIEDEEQGKILYKLGCSLGQGYFYSRPIPVKEFVDKYVEK